MANWLQRYTSSTEVYKFKSVKFSSLRASNCKMSGLIPPKIELDRAFTPVLVTSNFEDDSIKNVRGSMKTPFPIISLWEIFKMLKGS